jgi:prophage regulatory protein
MNTTIQQIPEVGFLRINQIVKTPNKTTPAIIPVSRSSWLAGVKSGKYPKPVKLGERMTAWRVSDIRDLIEKMGA